MWTVVGWDAASRSGLVDHVEGGSALEAARSNLLVRRGAGSPSYVALACYVGRIPAAATIQDADIQDMDEDALPGATMGGLRGRGIVARPLTVVAFWRAVGELLAPEGALARAASGIEAMGIVQARIAPPEELQVVAVLVGHHEPALTPETMHDD